MKRIGIFIFAALFAFALIPIGAFTEKAYAGSVWLETGRRVNYGGYYTNEFWVNGVLVYCAEATKSTPNSGSYTKSPLYALATSVNPGGDPGEVAKALYYGYGGPGFNTSMWPKYDYAGNPMSRDMYIAATHILISDAFACNADAAVSGTSYQFKQWCYQNILIYDGPSKGTYTWYGVQANIRDYDYYNPMPASFESECFSLATGSGNQIICGRNPGGTIEVFRSSASPDITTNNSNYNLQSAKYELFSNYECTDKLLQSYTSAKGRTAYYLPAGMYFIKEAVPSKGYMQDQTIYPVNVTDDVVDKFGIESKPQSCTTETLLELYDEDLGYSDTGNSAQGAASLAGAQYSFSFYPTYFNSVEEAVGSGAPSKNWIFATGDNGIIRLSDYYQVSGDNLYWNIEGMPTLPLGTYIISRLNPALGYVENNSPTILRHVNTDNAKEQPTYDAPKVNAQIARGNITIEKRDAESGLLTPLGAASLDGAVFQVINDSGNPVVVDGNICQPGQPCATMTIKNNTAQLPDKTLPYGNYKIEEIAAGEGHNLTSATSRYFDILNDGTTLDLVESLGFGNYVNRGDIKFVALREDDMQPLAGIPFRITSETTSESHIILADENGVVNTSAEHLLHTSNMNENDFVADGTYNQSAGIWFGLVQNGGSVPPNNSLGALPYDTYTIEELRCPANAGYTLIRQEHIAIRENGVIVDLGTLKNMKPSIISYAADGFDGDKFIMAEPDSHIIDHVEYLNLFPGQEYALKATLINCQDGQPAIDKYGNVIEVVQTFNPDASTGIIDVSLYANLTEFGNKQLTVFEELFCDNEVVATYKETTDSSHAIWTKTSTLNNTLVDAFDGDKQIIIDTQCQIIDTITYSNLLPGTEYQLNSRLVTNNGGKVKTYNAQTLMDANGYLIEEKTTFIPIEPSGTIDVLFSFDGSDLNDELEIMAFETLSKNGEIIARHEDINNSAQIIRVSYPQIKATAKDKLDNDKEIAKDIQSVVLENIQLSNLIPNKTYTLYGALLDRNSAEIDWEAIMNAADNLGASFDTYKTTEAGEDTSVYKTTDEAAKLPWIAIAKTEINAGSNTAVLNMEYKLSQKVLEHENLFSGQATVVNILHDGKRVLARNDNLDNEEQSVTVIEPSIFTEATDYSDGNHDIAPNKEMIVLDTVYYGGLVSGETYEIHGTLMDKAKKEQLTINGKPIEESMKFTPDSSEGSLTLALEVDTSTLPIGTEVVVFEEISKAGVSIVNDKNLENLNETVRVNRPSEDEVYAKTGIPYALIPLAIGLILAGGIPLAYLASKRWLWRRRDWRGGA